MYVTARGATNALTVSLAQELGRDNIQVNAIAPNYVESPTYFPPELVSDPATLAKMTRNIPLKRLGKPEEVAALVAFYASDKSDFITGHVVPFRRRLGLSAQSGRRLRPTPRRGREGSPGLPPGLLSGDRSPW